MKSTQQRNFRETGCLEPAFDQNSNDDENEQKPYRIFYIRRKLNFDTVLCKKLKSIKFSWIFL